MHQNVWDLVIHMHSYHCLKLQSINLYFFKATQNFTEYIHADYILRLTSFLLAGVFQCTIHVQAKLVQRRMVILFGMHKKDYLFDNAKPFPPNIPVIIEHVLNALNIPNSTM